MAEPVYIGGFHAVMAALDSGAPPLKVILAGHRRDARSREITERARAASVPVELRPRSDLDLLAPDLRHQGVVALLPEGPPAADDVLSRPADPARPLLVLDGVQDPHNLGACLRSAEAAGVAAVVVPKDRAAGRSAGMHKASAGAAERVPLLTVTNLARCLAQLKERGYWIVGLAGEAEASLYDTDLTGPLALVLGGEESGLRRLTREHCDRLVRIPMLGQSGSLNVSVAAGVALFEALRQRTHSG